MSDPMPSSSTERRQEESSAQAVLERLLREAADAVPGLSSDPTLTDPLVRLLLSSVAKEYSRLYGKLDEVIDLAYRRLVQNLLSFPRAPSPSSTVLQLTVKDPHTRVDDDLRVVGRMAIPVGGQQEDVAIHFAPLQPHSIPGLPSPVVVLEDPSGVSEVLAEGGEAPGETARSGGSCDLDYAPRATLHVGIDLPSGHDQEALLLFIAGPAQAVRRLVWSSWGAGESGVGFVPGQAQGMESWDGRGNPPLFRGRTDIEVPDSPYDSGFVELKSDLLMAGVGSAPRAVDAAIEAGILPSAPRRCWVQIQLGKGLSPADARQLRILTNCVVAFNQNLESAVFDLNRQPVQQVDLPVAYDELFRIIEVRDSANILRYEDAERLRGVAAPDRFHMESTNSGGVRLLLRATSRSERPRRIEVTYTTTMGELASGLGPGSISSIFDRRLLPGVLDAVNVVASTGGGEATSQPDHVAELRALLTSRGRAITRKDFEDLTMAFDPSRIESVEIGRGVLRSREGFVSCVQIDVMVAAGSFTGKLEREEFRAGLHDHLQSRAAAGQAISVRLKEAGRDGIDA